MSQGKLFSVICIKHLSGNPCTCHTSHVGLFGNCADDNVRIIRIRKADKPGIAVSFVVKFCCTSLSGNRVRKSGKIPGTGTIFTDTFHIVRQDVCFICGHQCACFLRTKCLYLGTIVVFNRVDRVRLHQDAVVCNRGHDHRIVKRRDLRIALSDHCLWNRIVRRVRCNPKL